LSAAQDIAAGGGVEVAVGRTLREMREARKMTARDLAGRAGISAAMVSRIEAGRVSASLKVLEQLAAALETPPASLFRDMGAGVADFTHVRAGQGLGSIRTLGEHTHMFTVLGFHRRRELQFEAVMVTIERNERAAPPTYTGHGCVFVYVLEGEAVYRYGRRTVTLGPGDSVSLDAEIRYGVQEVLTPRLHFLSVQAESR